LFTTTTPAGWWCRHCRERDPLERLTVHAVAADARGAGQLHVGQDTAVAGDGLHREAVPLSACGARE
jgi:hypothetical protein